MQIKLNIDSFIQDHVTFRKESLRKLTENYVVNNSKIKAALQIESLPISSREGFSITLKSF